MDTKEKKKNEYELIDSIFDQIKDFESINFEEIKKNYFNHKARLCFLNFNNRRIIECNM